MEKTAEVIQQVIVTVADVVQVAIQVMDAGISKVFHFIVKTVEDAVRTIGSFFVSLGKLIIHTIEALSLLFHFGEILATHKLIMDLVREIHQRRPRRRADLPRPGQRHQELRHTRRQ